MNSAQIYAKSLQEASERAKMLVHFQEAFLRITLQEYPRLGCIEVASKWLSGYSIEFSPNILVNSNYVFYGYDNLPLEKLTELFKQVIQPISFEQIDELVRRYVNCDVFYERETTFKFTYDPNHKANLKKLLKP